MANLITKKEAAKMIGCTKQTIKNWIDKGILVAHSIESNGQTRQMVDKDAVKRFVPTLKEIANIEKRVQTYKEEIMKADNDLNAEVKYKKKLCEAFGHNDYTAVYSAIADLLRCFVEYHADALKAREYAIVMEALNGKSLTAIGEEFGLTTVRIRQIIGKAVFRLSGAKDEYKTLKESNDELRKENKALREVCTVVKEDTVVELGTTEVTEEDMKLYKVLSESADILLLPVRAKNVLRRMRCNTILSVVLHDRTDFMKSRNCGIRTISDIEDGISLVGEHAGVNLYLGMDVGRLYKRVAASIVN